jgi:hypothetical protein
MTQLEILKYAYVGALETVESLRKMACEVSIDRHRESLEGRLAAADRDFEEIRDQMFAEIAKETGIDFEAPEPEQEDEPAALTFKVILQDANGKRDYLTGLTKQEAVHVCENNDWSYTDENDFVWFMGYEPEGG